MKSTLLALTLLFVVNAQASVWNSNKHWNKTWQKRYSNWVATSVNQTFFKDLGRPFNRLKIDCADAHYALKAYFARKHGLHMIVQRGSLSNKTTKFDRYGSSNEKLYRFIIHLANNYGTESIAHNDSYPVSISDVQSGDLFMYKVGSNGNYTRHTYIVKNINIDGTFDVLYSTQDRGKKGRALGRQRTYMFKKAPLNSGSDRNHWGFRRAKMSQHAGLSQEKIGLSDFSQYRQAKRLGRLGFFRKVRAVNRSINESPNRVAERNFKSVCHAVKDRVASVKSAVSYAKSRGGACMNERDYDTYSTPSRDSGIKDDYSNYQYDVNNVSWSRLNDYNQSLFSLTFNNSISGSGKKTLNKSCNVSTRIGNINLSNFRSSLFRGNVSFHPNDNIYRRWGISSGQRTSCYEYYGYPQ